MHVSYEERFRTREDNIKFKLEKDVAEKRLLKSETERSRLERDLRQAVTDVKNIDREARSSHKELVDERQRVEVLLRERNTLARGKETAQDRIKRINRELLLSEHAKRKIERDMDILTQSSYEMKTQLEVAEKERDRCNLTVQDLERQVKYRFTLATFIIASLSLTVDTIYGRYRVFRVFSYIFSVRDRHVEEGFPRK